MTEFAHRIPVDRIRVNDWNPNAMDEAEYAALKANIDRQGFTQPILVRHVYDENGSYLHPPLFEIVDGEHRFRACCDLGMKHIYAVVRGMGDDEARAQTVAMNTVRGTMDEKQTAQLLHDLDYEPVELAEFTGFTLDDLTSMERLLDFDLRSAMEDTDPEPIPDDERWVNVTVRCPESVAVLVRNELDRVKALLDLEHDHLALEVVTVQSSQVPDPMVGA